MTTRQTVSISTVAFDGYPLPVAIDLIARIGAPQVEIAYIEGYIDPFTEEVFDRAHALSLRRRLLEAGLSCSACSAHLDLSAAEVVEVFQRRMEFARELGAAIVVSNAGPPSRRREFLRNLERIAVRAQALGLTVALENPGNGRENLLGTGLAASRLIESLGLPNVGINYDFANLITHLRDRVRPEEDYQAVLPHTVHLHIKDVAADSAGWSFPAIGKGCVDYPRILSDPGVRGLPLSIEVPLRLHRLPDGSPQRGAEPVGLARITAALEGSFRYIQRLLSNTS